MNGGQYCYPDNDVLINKYNIHNKELLQKLEIQKVTVKLLGLDINPKRIKATFDTKHLQAVHKYLFGDIYEWAGDFREENFFKSERVLSGGSAEYADYRQIKLRLNNLFEKYNRIKWSKEIGLENAVSDFFLELWSIHPFREGNTRTCVTFLWHYLKFKGIEFCVELIRNNPMYVRDSLVMANYDRKEYLQKIISDALNCLSTTEEYQESGEEKAEQYRIAESGYQAFRDRYSIRK